MQLFFVDFIPPLDQSDFKIDLVFFYNVFTAIIVVVDVFSSQREEN